MKKRVCAVVPVYNEAKVVAETLQSLPKTIQGIPVDIVAINDGSTDDTETVVRSVRGVQVINHIMNMGAGAATRTGLAYAKKQGYAYAVTVDADGQHHHEDVQKVVEAILDGEVDMVIGSRLLVDSTGMPWYRSLGNKGLNLFTAMLFGIAVSDSQSGLKALNAKAIQAMNFHSNRFAFSSEMIWRAKQNNLEVKEISIRAIYTKYSLAKGQSNWGVLEIVRQLIKQKIMGLING